MCRDITYVKTFGGKHPVVSIHLINSRFVVYPETVKESSVSGAMFNDMKAITHIYDAKQKKIIYSSNPYQYNHDVPLKYSYLDVLVFAENEDLFDSTDAEKDRAGRPDTVPEKKTERRKNASPD